MMHSITEQFAWSLYKHKKRLVITNTDLCLQAYRIKVI
jgi:hypothetical protein